MKRKEWGKIIAALILIAGAASVPLLTDCNHKEGAFLVSLSRIYAIWQNMGSVFPVRILPMETYEYGYEAAFFQADVFYFVPALLGLLGMSLDMAYKAALLFANIATAAAAYLCFGKCFGKRGVGLAGSMLFTWCPYRLNEMYVNGDLGEVFGWIFLPAAVSCFMELCMMDRTKREYGELWMKLGLVFGLLALASLPLFFVTAGMLLFGFFIMGRRLWHKECLLVLGKAAAVVCLLDAWFIAPAGLWLLRNGGAAVSEDFAFRAIYLPRYFSVFFWGGSNASVEEGLLNAQALCPGIGVMLPVLLYLWILFTGRYGRNKMEQMGKWMLLLSLVLMFLSSTFFPWKALSWKIFYEESTLAAVTVSLFRTPAKWGAPACALLAGVACFALCRIAEKEKKDVYPYLLLVTAGISFGAAQIFFSNLQNLSKAAAGEEIAEWIPFQVYPSESFGWRVCELISAAALCALLAAFVWRRRKRRQDA